MNSLDVRKGDRGTGTIRLMSQRGTNGGTREYEIAQIVPDNRRPNAVAALANPARYKTHQQRGDCIMRDDARVKLRIDGDESIGAGT
jgi:hypothetical protein